MAFIAFEHGPTFLAPAADALLAPPMPVTPPARLSALEWLVVAIARRDRPPSLRRSGRFLRAVQGLFSRPASPLADDKLEALRRMAVLTWRHGVTVPPSEVDAFLAAGFSRDQYQAMVESIGVARDTPSNRKQ